MGSFSDLSQVIYTATGGTGAKESLFFHTDNRIGAGAGAATVAAQWTSLWTFNTFPGGQGAAPGATARNPTRSTAGALGQTDATGGRTKRLCGFTVNASVALSGWLYDRLADYSGLSATTTTAQNTTSLAVSRYTGSESVGNFIAIEIYTLIGTTATTITVSYTNQAGTSGRTTVAVVFGGTGRREATRMIMCPLQAGDTGVQSVQSVTVAATTGTAGDFGVTIIRPICQYVIAAAGLGTTVDLIGMIPTTPEIQTDACLTNAIFATTTTSPFLIGQLAMLEA